MIDDRCYKCLYSRQVKSVEHIEDKQKSKLFLEQARSLIKTNDQLTAPVVLEKLNELYASFFGKPFSFEQVKMKYNRFMLTKENEISQLIKFSSEPLVSALKYARAGNYIDFGALDSVDEKILNEIIEKTETENLDIKTLEKFKSELASKKTLVYLTDNCGEIVFDKILIDYLQDTYKNLKITVMVRGNPVLNDATMADAEFIGLTKFANVIDNGTAIPGTALDNMPQHLADIVKNADMVISKGQGNFETLTGCNLNIYYLFLCKCDMFSEIFGVPQFTGMFINEMMNK